MKFTDEDGPPLGVKDIAVLTAIVKIPELGGKLCMNSICDYTGLDAHEVFEILKFLEENEFINVGSLQ